MQSTVLACLSRRSLPLSVTKTGDKLHSWRGAPHPADIATTTAADSACYLSIYSHVIADLRIGGDANVYYPDVLPRVVSSLLLQLPFAFIDSSICIDRHVDIIKLVAA